MAERDVFHRHSLRRPRGLFPALSLTGFQHQSESHSAGHCLEFQARHLCASGVLHQWCIRPDLDLMDGSERMHWDDDKNRLFPRFKYLAKLLRTVWVRIM